MFHDRGVSSSTSVLGVVPREIPLIRSQSIKVGERKNTTRSRKTMLGIEEVSNYVAEFQLVGPHLSVSVLRTASITFIISW